MTLSSVLAPISPHSFYENYWSKAPFRIARDSPAHYSQLLSKESFDEFLFSASALHGSIEVLEEGERKRAGRTYYDFVSALESGSSLRINSVQRFSLPIATLCSEMESHLSALSNVNMYVSPGDGTKALKRHHDTHDVLVLQLFGKKRWRLYSEVTDTPLEYLPLLRRETVEDMRQYRLKTSQQDRDKRSLHSEFVLGAGDFLYVPRGVWHEAESEPGQISCHLTVGIQILSYLDLLSLMLSRTALEDPLLRQALPYGFARDGAGILAISNAIDTFDFASAKAQMIDAVGDMTHHFLTKHRSPAVFPRLGEDASELPSLHLDSVVQIRPGAIFHIDHDRASRMVIDDNLYEVDPAFREACEHLSLLRRSSIAALPGTLNTAQKETLVTQLFSLGVLILGDDPATHSGVVAAPRWLPMRVHQSGKRVTWLDCRGETYPEPFFQASLKRIRSRARSSSIVATRGTVLKDYPPCQDPTALIFHVSRCGSTLVSNCLKRVAGHLVVSEPPAVNDLLQSIGTSALPLDASELSELEMMLRNAVRLLVSADDKPSYTQRIVKLSSWNILYLPVFRRLFPQTNIIVLTRDPVEVAVSCLRSRPGWLSTFSDGGSRGARIAGLTEISGDASSYETVCGHVLDLLYEAADKARQAGATVLDYKDLSLDKLIELVGNLGGTVSEFDSRQMAEELGQYSKRDIGSISRFKDDALDKQMSATESLVALLNTGALRHYRELIGTS